MHSDRELGISTAAMVQLACAIPNLTYAIDSHYHDQADDIVTEPWVYRDGRFDLPDRARASASSSIATSSTSTTATSSTTPRSTSSTTRTGRTGCPHSRSSECRIAR